MKKICISIYAHRSATMMAALFSNPNFLAQANIDLAATLQYASEMDAGIRESSKCLGKDCISFHDVEDHVIHKGKLPNDEIAYCQKHQCAIRRKDLE